MEVIYARISTPNQKVERQMRQEGKKVYIDVCSGSIPFAERSEGKKIIELAKVGKITDVQVCSIDRLGRNLGDILKTVEFLTEHKVNLYIEDQGLNTMIKSEGKPNPTAKLIIDVMASVYEFERKIINERMQQGREIAKAKGKYKGRQRGARTSTDKLQEKHKELIYIVQNELNNGKPLSAICREHGYNRPHVYQLIKRGLIKKDIKEMSE